MYPKVTFLIYCSTSQESPVVLGDLYGDRLGYATTLTMTTHGFVGYRAVVTAGVSFTVLWRPVQEGDAEEGRENGNYGAVADDDDHDEDDQRRRRGRMKNKK